MKKLLASIFLLPVIGCTTVTMPVHTGEPLPDTDGVHVNAHGGNIINVDGTYYWYGEQRGDGTPGSFQSGVSCYTSTDLRTWHNRGLVLSVSDIAGDPLEQGCLLERPKVVFCPATGKYVLWFHHELKGRGYDAAQAAVAESDSPLGPFTLIGTSRVNAGIYPEGMTDEQKNAVYPDSLKWWTPEWYEAVEAGLLNLRDHDGGQMARDMTIYVDDDGTAYHIFASEENLTLVVAELDSTYTRHTGRYTRVAPGGRNEAPVIFKHDGTYWMITSGCTGWAPNAARLMKAKSVTGPWEQLPNPCRGENAETTFMAQGTSVMELDGNFTFMADRWNPDMLCDSRHLWIPIQFDADGTPYLELPKNQ